MDYAVDPKSNDKYPQGDTQRKGAANVGAEVRVTDAVTGQGRPRVPGSRKRQGTGPL